MLLYFNKNYSSKTEKIHFIGWNCHTLAQKTNHTFKLNKNQTQNILKRQAESKEALIPILPMHIYVSPYL